MVWDQEQQLSPTSAPTPGNTDQFIDAMKTLLDEGDISTLHALANRLSPFQINFKQVVVGDAVAVKPVIVLEDGQPSIFDSLESGYGGYLNPGLATESLNWSSSSVPTSSHSGGSTVEMLQNTQLVELPQEVRTNYEIAGYMNNILVAENMGEIGRSSSMPSITDMSETSASSAYRSSSQQQTGNRSRCSVFSIDAVDFSLNSPSYSIAPNVESVQGTGDEHSNSLPTDHTFTNCRLEGDSLNHTSLGNAATSSIRTGADRISSSPVLASHRWLEIPPDRQTCEKEGSFVASQVFCAGQAKTSSTVPDARCSINEAKRKCPGKEEEESIISATAMSKVSLAARTCIRADYIQFLEMNLPHWTRDGLWPQKWPTEPMVGLHGYNKLQRAYSCVCRLDQRMGDDPIRSRMAMIFLYSEYEKGYQQWKAQNQDKTKTITGVGRGNASSMIDNILASTHPEWNTCDARETADLRAKFHDRKRYGKRWWILVNALGPGILVLSSSKLAGMIKNTTITAKMLAAVAHAIQTCELDVMGVLTLINPVAESLFRDQGYESHDGKRLLGQLRTAELRFGEEADDHVE